MHNIVENLSFQRRLRVHRSRISSTIPPFQLEPLDVARSLHFIVFSVARKNRCVRERSRRLTKIQGHKALLSHISTEDTNTRSRPEESGPTLHSRFGTDIEDLFGLCLEKDPYAEPHKRTYDQLTTQQSEQTPVYSLG